MAVPSEYFLSCDWGTSAFRLRLVNAVDLTIVAEESNDKGIASTFEAWQQTGKQENERLSFYQTIIQESLGLLEQKLNHSLQGTPLILSGMASSTIGMFELPYKDLPFNLDGTDLKVHTIKATDNFKHDILLISGVKSDDDVMRGEEIQIAGCADGLMEEQIFIKPGTHSKHIRIKEGKAVAFKTYMTGEFFSVLSKESILSSSIEKVSNLDEEKNKNSFEKGVMDSTSSNILHACFLVRTNNLFNKLDKQQNYCYLSGLLIGTELKELINKETTHITLLTNNVLKPYYRAALRTLEIAEDVRTKSVDEAMIKGHAIVYRLHKSK